MVPSNSDAFPFSGPTLRTVRPPEVTNRAGAKEKQDHSFPPKSKAGARLILIAVFLLSALYMAKELKRGWVPHDEGTFAQSAERVLQGQLPHRDFDEGYTGGLTYLNALAFRLLGTNLASLRYAMYLFFLAWVPATYYVASRFVSSPVAGAVTVLAVAWGPPNYSAAMPSWYNLFFATFGIAALLRYTETEERRWLLAASLCGGFSFLFKVTGLYFVAGVLLFLVLREQVTPSTKPAGRIENILYRIFVVFSVLLYEALLFNLLRQAESDKVFFSLWLPNLAVGAAIVWIEIRLEGRRGGRFAFLFSEIALLAAGFSIPIFVFLVPDLLGGSVAQSAKQFFFLTAHQVTQVRAYPPAVRAVYGILANVLFIALAFLTPPRIKNAFGILVLLSVPFTLFLIRVKEPLYVVGWGAVWILVPIVLILGVTLMVRWWALRQLSAIEVQQLFLVLSVAASCSLIQFPLTATVYLCYVAPLIILAATALVGCVPRPPRLPLVGAAIFLLLYVILDVQPGFVYAMGREYAPDMQTARLTLPRAGGLRVFPESAQTYEQLGVVLGRHAKGEYIYAAPDCPEVYFLYGFRNPTRTLFDFQEGPVGRIQRILAAVNEHDIQVVVLNREPQFSGPVPPDLRAALEYQFPNRAEVGKFEVRWKN